METMAKAKVEFDVENIRKEFPILSVKVHGKPLVYFDNAASSQKPLFVIKAIEKYYETVNSNVHRGVHSLSAAATDQFEAARRTVAAHINAKPEEVIYTRGTTEAINLVAFSFGETFIKEGDEIIITQMEHHSNIVPWQMLCQRKKAVLKYVPITDKGELKLDEYKKLLSAKTKLVAVCHISNSLGTINPVEEIISLAHAKNIPVLLDGAQAVPHMKVDVKKLDCDFYCFSGHKIYGPTGIGILYGKEKWLKEMVPYQGGGEMIKEVTLAKTTYNEAPFKFEAGTPHIEGSIVIATAIDYLNKLGLENIAAYEHSLLKYATEKLSAIEGLKIVGQAPNKSAIVAFNIDGLHPYDIGVILDQMGIAVRTGHHCTQPIMDCFGIPGTVRASFSFYNTIEEIDKLVDGVKKAIQILKK